MKYNNKDFIVVATDGEIDLVQAVNYDEDMDYYLDIYLHDTDTLVGDVNYRFKTDTYTGNVGYNIYEEYRGHRYATKALLLLKELLNQRGFQNMVISVVPNNVASVKTALGAGSKLVCVRSVPPRYKLYSDSPSHQVLIYQCETGERKKWWEN